ncbi:GNAT family N-acetyltransferase [Loktanella agnita]|uniref:GNAT family N-acetyltransferase n=1 Tax=Loktanella agnita TaxID=287097 RepID=UPI003985DC9A
MTVPDLRTPRLTLHAPIAQDAAVIAASLNNFAISKWLSSVPYPYAVSDADWFIGEVAQGRVNAWAIWQDDSFRGMIGLDTFGYWLAQQAWGQGIATEAGQAVIAHHFTTSDTKILRSSYMVGNTASCNVLTKLGFRDVGDHMLPCLASGADMPARRMELTRADWDARPND